jgi:arylsulfatase A-like enzyme
VGSVGQHPSPRAGRIFGALAVGASRALTIAIPAAGLEWALLSATGELFAPGATALALLSLNLILALVAVAAGEATIALVRHAGISGPWLPWRRDPVRALERAGAASAAVAASLALFLPIAGLVEASVARASNRILLLAAVAVLTSVAAILAAALAHRWLRRARIASPRRWLAGLGAVLGALAALAVAVNAPMLAVVDPRVVFAAAAGAAIAISIGPVRRIRWPRRVAIAAALIALVLAHLPLGLGPVSRELLRHSYSDVALRGAQSGLVMAALEWLLPAPPARASRFPFAPPPPSRGGPPVARHLVLVTVDALRADHVSAYGYERPTTPAIDRFFASGVRFERCYTSSPATVTGLLGLHYGVYPTRARWRASRNPRVDHVPGRSLAERLAAAGFSTHSVIYQTYGGLHQEALRRGFADRITNPDKGVPGEWKKPRDLRMASRAIEIIQELDDLPGRHFVWLHFGDPHEAYLLHAPPARFGRRAIDRYDGEIRFTDGAFARVAEALAATEWGARAMVVLTSDHGEAFGEHSTRFHGYTAHDEELRVPCLIRWPGSKAAVIERPVSTIDVAPTAVDLLAAGGAGPFDGASWGPRLRGADEIPARPLFAMVHRREPKQYAVIDGRRKALFGPRGRLLVAFDVVADPGERAPLHLAPGEAQELADRLAGWLAATEP